MRVAILGCGYVSEYYLGSLRERSDLTVAGVYDRDRSRTEGACALFGHTAYESYEDMLRDPSVDIVVNLTPPDAHFDTTRRALLANKHVYSEKPMAVSVAAARELVVLARERRRLLCSAPSTVLGATAQTLWKAIREGAIGRPRVVYAELDDGPVHFRSFRNWRGRLGVPWPFVSEFSTGCTMEHAAYYLTWLTAFFGPIRRVAATSRCVYPDKGVDMGPAPMAPDLSMGLLQFASGVSARITCGLVAPTDHSLMVVGDDGVLQVEDGWDVFGKVLWRRRTAPINARPNRHLAPATELPLLRAPRPVGYESSHNIDFAAGIADMADALRTGQRPRLDCEHALHVLEVTSALQDAGDGVLREFGSEFPPTEPLSWAT